MKQSRIASLLIVILLIGSTAHADDVWLEDFSGLTGTGIQAGAPSITNMTGITNWGITANDPFSSNGYFVVSSNTTLGEFFAGSDLDQECVWYTESIDISTNSPVDVSVDISETGTQTDSDYIKVAYQANGSAETLFQNNGSLSNQFGATPIQASQQYVVGTSLVVVVRTRNSTKGKVHRFDNIHVIETEVFADSIPEIVINPSETNVYARVGDEITLTVSATENLLDLADEITLSGDNLPAGASFSTTSSVSPISQTFTWTPTAVGNYDFAFDASDKDGTNRITITALISQLDPGHIWFNEIHYDNDSSDTNEGFEIAGPANWNLSNYAVYHYNGYNGEVVSGGRLPLSGAIDDEKNSRGAVWFDWVGLQNGGTDPEGLALVRESEGVTNLLQFLSYEGTFVAVEGPADGVESTDIGVNEPDTTPGGQSLQLTGIGKVYADFTWTGPTNHSRGFLNASQDIRLASTIFVVH